MAKVHKIGIGFSNLCSQFNLGQDQNSYFLVSWMMPNIQIWSK